MVSTIATDTTKAGTPGYDKRGRPIIGFGQMAIASEKTQNSKLAGKAGKGKRQKFTGEENSTGISTTLVAQGSCPEECVFLNHGCYAQQGPLGWLTARLNASNPNATPVELAEAEAAAIDTLSGKNHLRLHVVGDCKTNDAATIVSLAAGRFMAKFGRKVWTYTHAWFHVMRESWDKVSVLASCETIAQVKRAHARGYATAMVVPHFPDGKKVTTVDGFRLTPCLEQTGVKASCHDCRLCWDDVKLREKKIVILFETHGAMESTANKALDKIANLFVEAESDAFGLSSEDIEVEYA